MDTWQSEQINELMAALNRAQLALKPASKDRENPFYHSRYADLATVWEALDPIRQEGIVVTQSPMESPDGFVVLDTQLTHVSGQWIRSRLKMRVAKDDPQGAGSALTYARRYALGCMTGLVTEEDDDGNAASQPSTPAAKVVANKTKAQAKIQELKQEGTNGSFVFGFGLCKGQTPAQVSDGQLEWYRGHYSDKILADPNSRYKAEWEEGVLAIEEEQQARTMNPVR